jgi:protein O-mannosyl-transferase
VLASVGLLALVLWTYAPVRQFDFVPIDDPSYVTGNPHVVTGLTWENVVWAFTSRWASYWIPATWISYMVEVQIFGVQPGVQHVTNVLLHAANTLLLLLWLYRETGAVGRSTFVAALFALHPLHVESVAWITERKDVLSTLFLLLAILAYSAYQRNRSTWRYAALCGCFVAGLLAKPMLVTLPGILLLCDVWPLARAPRTFRTAEARRSWWLLVREKWPLYAIAIGVSAAAFVTQRQGGAMYATEVFPLGLRVSNAIVSYAVYLGQSIWPSALTVNYPYPSAIPLWTVIGAAVLLVVVSGGAVRAAGNLPFLAVGWFWFIGTLVPVIGLVQVGLQPRADRFTYVPLVGVFIAASWGLVELGSRLRIRQWTLVGVAVAVTLAYTAVARQQVEHWRNGVTLWTHAVAVTPRDEAVQAQFDLGRALLDQGRPEDAIPHLMEAVRIQPGFAGAHGALGDALSRSGRKAEARAEYERCLGLDSGFPEVQNNLGAILASNGLIAAAIPHFEAAVRLKPDLESARVNLGVSYIRLGRTEEGIRELSSALRLNPKNAQAQHILELLTKR